MLIPLYKSLKERLRNLYHESKFRLHFSHVSVGTPNILNFDDPGGLKFAEGSKIRRFCEIVVQSKSSFSSVPGKLWVGANTVIGSFANIRAAGGTIEIGNNVLIAQHVSLIASNHLVTQDQCYADARWDEERCGIKIGSNVWLGCGVTVLPGVEIGDNCIIASGSVVNRSVLANEIWGGVPAKQIKVLVALKNG